MTTSFIQERLTGHKQTKSVMVSSFLIKPPLVKPSKLTTVTLGGVGKNLSHGWAVNFAVGCTHACPFCYVDSIWKNYGRRRFGPIIDLKWGNYLLLPRNLSEAIEKTPWERWQNIEVLMSSTHDPYLPQLADGARQVLNAGLPVGVRFCIQTRSPLAVRDIPLMSDYRSQVRLQVSIATLERGFARLIEPRVAPPESRLALLSKARDAGLKTGVIIAPVFPSVPQRPDWRADLEAIFEALGSIRPDYVYGESLHARGMNLLYLKNALGVEIRRGDLIKLDREAGRLFKQLLKRYKLRGSWWYEYNGQ